MAFCEYFCHKCYQLRLHCIEDMVVQKCGNCGSTGFTIGELDSLDKAALTARWQDGVLPITEREDYEKPFVVIKSNKNHITNSVRLGNSTIFSVKSGHTFQVLVHRKGRFRGDEHPIEGVLDVSVISAQGELFPIGRKTYSHVDSAHSEELLVREFIVDVATAFR